MSASPTVLLTVQYSSSGSEYARGILPGSSLAPRSSGCTADRFDTFTRLGDVSRLYVFSQVERLTRREGLNDKLGCVQFEHGARIKGQSCARYRIEQGDRLRRCESSRLGRM